MGWLEKGLKMFSEEMFMLAMILFALEMACIFIAVFKPDFASLLKRVYALVEDDPRKVARWEHRVRRGG